MYLRPIPIGPSGTLSTRLWYSCEWGIIIRMREKQVSEQLIYGLEDDAVPHVIQIKYPWKGGDGGER